VVPPWVDRLNRLANIFPQGVDVQNIMLCNAVSHQAAPFYSWLGVLKVQKNDNFFGFDFEFCTVSLIVMLKYEGFVKNIF
jgi:hypothetical protein